MRLNLFLVLAAALCACATTTRPPPAAEAERTDPVTVVLARKTHYFAGPDAAPVVPEPGRYRVEAAGQKTLRLVAADGKSAVDLPALEGTHKEPIEVPVAFTLQSDEDTEQVVLRLPGGKALHAVGSYSGSRPRGILETPTKVAPLDPLTGCKCVEIGGVDFTPDPREESSWAERAGYGEPDEHHRGDYFVNYWGAAADFSWVGAESLHERASASGSTSWLDLASGPKGLPLGAVLRGVDILWFDSDPHYDVVLTIQEGFTTATSVAQVRSSGSPGYGWTRHVIGGTGIVNQIDDKLLTLVASLPARFGSQRTRVRAVRLWYTE